MIVIDAQRGLESQDVNIISLAQKQGKGMVIMVNKWDLIEKDTKTADKYKKEMLESLSRLIMFLSFLFRCLINSGFFKQSKWRKSLQ